MGDYVAQNSLNQTLVMSVFSFLFFFFFGTDLSMWRLREELTHTHGEAAENEPKMGDALLYTHTHGAAPVRFGRLLF